MFTCLAGVPFYLRLLSPSSGYTLLTACIRSITNFVRCFCHPAVIRLLFPDFGGFNHLLRCCLFHVTHRRASGIVLNKRLPASTCIICITIVPAPLFLSLHIVLFPSLSVRCLCHPAIFSGPLQWIQPFTLLFVSRHTSSKLSALHPDL